MIFSALHKSIKLAVTEAFPKAKPADFSLTHPEVESHGDYSTNVALLLAKSVKQTPLAVAETLVASLPNVAGIERVEIAGAGFINFFLSPAYLLKQLQTVIQETDSFGRTTLPQASRILLEFGTPNTHKVPHIGHLFSYCYGEACARLLDFAGHHVARNNYQGDVGLHVAKCLWAYRSRQQPDLDTLAAKVDFLQECYQRGSQAYEEDANAKAEIDELNCIIYQKDPTIMTDWQKTRAWSVDYYAQFEQRLGIRFDKHYFESQTSEIGSRIVKEKIGQVFAEDAGAIIFRGEPYGLHTRVFINSAGNPTYEAKDIGLAALKQQDFAVDLSVITTAVEQNEYWQVVKKVIELIWPELVGKIKHIGFGMIQLKTGKMSSRTGEIMTAFSLVEMVKNRIIEYLKTNRDYTAEDTETIAELVGLGAVKYSFLKSAPAKNMTFDLESSIAFEGNSGPYLQYTYARCQSVLRKAGVPTLPTPDHSKTLLNSDETLILRWLDRFPEVVAQAAEQYAPHLLCTYLFELAQRYSFFYNQHQIIHEDKATTEFRLSLTAAVGQVLKNGLNLLAIEVAEKI